MKQERSSRHGLHGQVAGWLALASEFMGFKWFDIEVARPSSARLAGAEIAEAATGNLQPVTASGEVARIELCLPP